MKTKESTLFCRVYIQGNGLYEEAHIYNIFDEDAEVSIRIDCGDKGSFEVRKCLGDEVYVQDDDEWVWKDEVSFSFISLHDRYDSYPELSIEDALKIFRKRLNRKG